MRFSKSFKLFIIGMPGAGKTTVGNALSGLLDLPFTDLDAEIVREHGPISEIFSRKSEAAFRAYEAQALKIICEADEAMIIATGGGTPCYSDNLALMKKSGLVLFIHTPLAVIAGRLQAKTGRPLLDGELSVTDKIDQLWNQRKMFYKQADVISEDPDPEEIKKRIEMHLQSAR